MGEIVGKIAPQTLLQFCQIGEDRKMPWSNEIEDITEPKEIERRKDVLLDKAGQENTIPD